MMRRRLPMAVLFGVAFALYVHGAYPSLSVGDAGEFMTAAATLGVPHPPGFPCYTVLVRCFHELMPWGNPGLHANLFSAFCGALGVTLLFGMLSSAGVRATLAAAAAAALMTLPAFVTNSRTTEVFTLHVCFVIATLWAAWCRQWLLAALLFGLAAHVHQTILFLMPAVTCLLWTQDLEGSVKIDLRFLSSACAIAAAGFLIAVWLPLRAARHPFLNVGDAETLQRWWNVLTRADYGSLTLALGDAPSRTVFNAARQLARLGQALYHESGLLGFIGFAAVFPLLYGWGARRAWALVIAFLTSGPAFILLGNLPFDAQSTAILQRFYIVPILCLLIFVPVMLEVLMRRFPAAAWLTILAIAAAWPKDALSLSVRHDFRGYSYARNLLRSVPTKGLLIMDGGDDTFYGMSYVMQAEHRRPDIEFYDRGGVVFPGLYGNDFRRLPRPQKAQRQAMIETSLLRQARPVVYSTMNPEILPGATLAPDGILYAPGSKADPWPLYDLRGVAPWTRGSSEKIADYRMRALVPLYTFQSAVKAGREQAWAQAERFALCTQVIGFDVLWVKPNLCALLEHLGFDAFSAGALEPAARFYRILLACDPERPDIWGNLGAVEQRLAQWDASERDLKRALALDPRSAIAHFNLAIAFSHLKRWPEAAAELQTVLSLRPGYPGAVEFLKQTQQM